MGWRTIICWPMVNPPYPRLVSRQKKEVDSAVDNRLAGVRTRTFKELIQLRHSVAASKHRREDLS